jgi:TolA-binding protein
MRKLGYLIALMLLALSGSAQTAQAQPQQPSQGPPMHHPMHDMSAMHQQHMQAMKAQLDQMRAKVEAMKANLSNVKDPALKQQLQNDVDLWEMMVNHMDQMSKMMEGPPGMMGHGMGQPCPGCDMHPAPPMDKSQTPKPPDKE